MEYSDFVDLPEDRCGFSDGEQTCVLPAWHQQGHRMVPRSWIQHTRGPNTGTVHSDVLGEVRWCDLGGEP